MPGMRTHWHENRRCTGGRDYRLGYRTRSSRSAQMGGRAPPERANIRLGEADPHRRRRTIGFDVTYD